MTASFHDQVIAILPKLRVQALALTRNRSVAEDLVQDTVCNALAAQDSFVMGTNFAAWMHRILRNRFISDLRKKREVGNIDDTPQSLLSVSGRHEDRLALKELDAALARLPDDQREALVLGVLEGMSYQELADVAGCAVGTAKSRVFRARRQLEVWLMGKKKAVFLAKQAQKPPPELLPLDGKPARPATQRVTHSRRHKRNGVRY